MPTRTMPDFYVKKTKFKLKQQCNKVKKDF